MKNKGASVPYIAWMFLFTLVPLAIICFFAFTDSNAHFTLANFKEIFETDYYIPRIVLSIWLGFISTVLCLVLGYPIAYMIAKSSERAQRILLMLVMLPMWVNFLLRTYAWMTLIEDNGLINKLIMLCGGKPIQMIGTNGAVVLGMVYNFLPFMIFPLYSVLTKMDKSVIEAAQDLGGNRFDVFRRIVFPLSLPGIMSGVTMVFVPAVSTFIISKMLSSGRVILIGDLIESKFVGGNYNPQLGSAMAIVLMVLVIIVISLTRQFDDDLEEITL